MVYNFLLFLVFDGPGGSLDIENYSHNIENKKINFFHSEVNIQNKILRRIFGAVKQGEIVESDTMTGCLSFINRWSHT